MKRLYLFLSMLCLSLPLFAQEITFTAETTTGTEQVTPVLTWSTFPAANRCTASGDWAGEKGPSGAETLDPISTSATYNLSCEWDDSTATVTWTPPTENTDGSPLSDLAGFILYYGTSDGGPYDNSVQLDDPNTTSHVFESLSPGDWFFVGSAYNELGIESEFSNQAQKVIEVERQVRVVGIVVNPRPNPLTNLNAQ